MSKRDDLMHDAQWAYHAIMNALHELVVMSEDTVSEDKMYYLRHFVGKTNYELNECIARNFFKEED